jgi:hypothetical protein
VRRLREAGESERWNGHGRAKFTDASHTSGTARLGTSPPPASSTPDCGVPRVGNLFVAGSGRVPGGGHAYPTSDDRRAGPCWLRIACARFRPHEPRLPCTPHLSPELASCPTAKAGVRTVCNRLVGPPSSAPVRGGRPPRPERPPGPGCTLAGWWEPHRSRGSPARGPCWVPATSRRHSGQHRVSHAGWPRTLVETRGWCSRSSAAPRAGRSSRSTSR